VKDPRRGPDFVVFLLLKHLDIGHQFTTFRPEVQPKMESSHSDRESFLNYLGAGAYYAGMDIFGMVGVEEKLASVKTLILHSPSRCESDELAHLLKHIPGLVSLVFTDGDLNGFEDNLDYLDPAESDSEHPPANRLQHIIFEADRRCALRHVCGCRSEMMENLLKVEARRRALGAAPLASVTFSLTDDNFEEPYVEEFPSDYDNGILCRIRVAVEEQQPSVLLTNY